MNWIELPLSGANNKSLINLDLVTDVSIDRDNNKAIRLYFNDTSSIIANISYAEFKNLLYIKFHIIV